LAKPWSHAAEGIKFQPASTLQHTRLQTSARIDLTQAEHDKVDLSYVSDSRDIPQSKEDDLTTQEYVGRVNGRVASATKDDNLRVEVARYAQQFAEDSL
jgi:ADP-dependent phosphofructokinase/glucokinase